MYAVESDYETLGVDKLKDESSGLLSLEEILNFTHLGCIKKYETNRKHKKPLPP